MSWATPAGRDIIDGTSPPGARPARADPRELPTGNHVQSVLGVLGGIDESLDPKGLQINKIGIVNLFMWPVGHERLLVVAYPPSSGELGYAGAEHPLSDWACRVGAPCPASMPT